MQESVSIQDQLSLATRKFFVESRRREAARLRRTPCIFPEIDFTIDALILDFEADQVERHG